MNAQRLIGVVLLAVGIVLLITGMNASHSVVDQVSRTFTGRFTQATTWYILGGIICGVSGLILMLFGSGAVTVAVQIGRRSCDVTRSVQRINSIMCHATPPIPRNRTVRGAGNGPHFHLLSSARRSLRSSLQARANPQRERSGNRLCRILCRQKPHRFAATAALRSCLKT